MMTLCREADGGPFLDIFLPENLKKGCQNNKYVSMIERLNNNRIRIVPTFYTDPDKDHEHFNKLDPDPHSECRTYGSVSSRQNQLWMNGVVGK